MKILFDRRIDEEFLLVVVINKLIIFCCSSINSDDKIHRQQEDFLNCLLMTTSPKRDSPMISAAATPVSDYPDLPLLCKYNEESSSMMSHLDENNENEAVLKIYFYKINYFYKLFRLHPWFLL